MSAIAVPYSDIDVSPNILKVVAYITCGHCGGAMVGEIKKRRYIYYHCTGFKGKCPGPYTREEVLADREKRPI
jgi:predicted metal-binding protein